MCGFAGFVVARSRFGATEARAGLKGMTDAIRHRGPDAEGHAVEEDGTGGVWGGLGHRRLSIIDLSAAGAQPMTSHCGRYRLAYNGEIYNFRDLRTRVEACRPDPWRGASDTEVLLESIALDGVEATLARVDGMFALALFDRATRRLTLARDAFGEKPLVYGLWRGVLLFGSELGALRAWPGFDPDEDAGARASLMQYGCIPAPATIHAGIFKLPAAHRLDIGPDDLIRGDLPAPKRWWDMTGAALSARQTPFEGGFTAATDAVEAALVRSVARRMVSDVPLGALLSGGIDSSLTTALMQRVSPTPVRSFTIGMTEAGYDESPHAEAVARHLGTRHETLMLSPSEILDEVPRIAARYDEPFADPSQLPTYLVSRMARGAVTVALSGDGGDELFGGYNRHFHAPRLWASMRHVPVALRGLAGAGLAAVPPAALDRLVRIAGPLAPADLAAGRAGEKLHKLARVLGARDWPVLHDALLRTGRAGAILAGGGDAASLLEGADLRLAGLDIASAAMLLDTAQYLATDVLTKVDRASMAVGLETRTPFLDRDLFDLAWRLPPGFKLEAAQGKRVLRAVLYRHVPRGIVDRPKAGFAIPVGRWLRGPLSDWAESLLSPDALGRRGVFDIARVRALWDAHRRGRRDHETQLWSVLMYQSWHASREVMRQRQGPG